MKKIFIILIIIIAYSDCFSQNVGIGTNTPSERLDINGNLNVSGNLKVNGVSGQSGQVLTTNSQGQTVWLGGNTEYKNMVGIYQNGVWNVPAGVTTVMIEMWGGGGGGAAGGGGASSTYLRLLNYSVSTGNSFTITIGAGGAGAISSGAFATDGGNTIIVFSQNNFTYTSYGGTGGKPSGPGSTTSIGGTSATNYFSMNSNSGQATTESYFQLTTTEFARATSYGNGGNSSFLNIGCGKGGFTSINTTNSIYIKKLFGTVGSGPGAGGGGGEDSQGNFGAAGAKGYVIIWY